MSCPMPEGPASCPVVWSQCDDPLGLAPGFAKVSKLLHAASSFAGERPFVETAHPLRRLLGMLAFERPLRFDEEPRAFVRLRHGGMTSGLHREQLSLKFGVWRMAVQRIAAALREGNGCLRLVPMVGEVAHAGQDMGAAWGGVAQFHEGEGTVEVLGCNCVAPGVVRHP